MTTPRFAAVGVAVPDMGRALAFYRALGLDIPAEADAAPHAEANLGGGLRIMFDTFDTVRESDPDWTPPNGSLVGLAFECADPAAVDATYEKLVAAGYDGHLAPWDAPWGQRYAVVHGPDGNGVDLFAPLSTTPAES